MACSHNLRTLVAVGDYTSNVNGQQTTRTECTYVCKSCGASRTFVILNGKVLSGKWSRPSKNNAGVLRKTNIYAGDVKQLVECVDVTLQSATNALTKLKQELEKFV